MKLFSKSVLFLVGALSFSACSISFSKVDVESISFDVHNLTIEKGQTDNIEYVVLPENASKSSLKLTISDETTISVKKESSRLVVTGLAAGNSTIKLEASNGIYDSCQVVVEDHSIAPGPATGITLNKSNLSIEEGKTYQLDATLVPSTALEESLIWTSDNQTVATVSTTGLVSGVSEGSTTITVTTATTHLFATCNVTVTASGEEEELWDSSQDYLRTGSKPLSFYSVNDTHGAVNTSASDNEPGLAQLSTYIKNQIISNPSASVLTSSGDMWQGSSDSNITRGQLVIDWMNYLGFSAMSLGNHEFDWTVDTIKSNMELANFPFLACNIVNKTTYQPVDWIQPYTTITRNGVHIGIIGSIGQGQTSSILATNVKDVTFANPTEYVIQHANYLRENGADLILYLTHNQTSSIDSSLASYVDLAFCAHTHVVEVDSFGGKPCVQAAKNGRYLGYIYLTYNFGTESISYGDYGASQVGTYNNEDADTLALWDKYQATIDEVNNRVVANYNNTISQNDIPNIYNQYAYQYYLDTKDALGLNYNIIAVETNNARATIYPTNGQILYGSIYKALPFDNCLTLIRITGSHIINNLATYGSSHWYLPSVQQDVDRNDLSNYISYSQTYYMLMIDYIALSDYYSDWMDIVHTYYEEDALPRNIVANYLSGYPGNIH